MSTDVGSRRLRVLIAGGGVAALETALALQALARELVDVTVLAPDPGFAYRPAAVAEAFGVGVVRRFDLEPLVQAAGARMRRGALSAVDVERRSARTDTGEMIDYDALVIACGAEPQEAVRGALTFSGDDAQVRGLIAEIDQGALRRIVFGLPGGVAWPVPIYELALLTAARVAEHELTGIELTLVTPEEAPLGLFGHRASESVAGLLERGGIALRTGESPVAFSGGRLTLSPAGHIEADRVIVLPRLRGPHIHGIPHDSDGFLRTDTFGRVDELSDVYAAGDVTAYPIKQGGLAAQQADAVAGMLAAEAGAPIDPEPYRPVLRGLLLTGVGPRYLRSEISGGRGDTSTVASQALWWPPSKIAGRYLAPFLAAREGTALPDAPDRPDAIEVEVGFNAKEA